jgi:hypothetical protein
MAWTAATRGDYERPSGSYASDGVDAPDGIDVPT